jgi:hypothetical protein
MARKRSLPNQEKTATEQPKFWLFRQRLSRQRLRISAENGMWLADNLEVKTAKTARGGVTSTCADRT